MWEKIQFIAFLTLPLGLMFYGVLSWFQSLGQSSSDRSKSDQNVNDQGELSKTNQFVMKILRLLISIALVICAISFIGGL